MVKNMVKINEEKCIGCMLCSTNFPDIFEFNEGKAFVRQNAILNNEDINKAKSECPVGAIE